MLGTGGREVGRGRGLLWPPARALAVGTTAFLLLIFPATLIAAFKRPSYQPGTFDGPGPRYLLFRRPLPTFFMARAWHFSRHLAT